MPDSSDQPPAILSLIGHTPLVEITRMDTGPCQLFVKLENQNPTGSILPVDGNAAVRSAYSGWDATPCDTSARNNVVKAINDHLQKFWDPRMRGTIVQHLHDVELDPSVREAVEQLRESRNN